MTVKVKFSNEYEARLKRIARLPQMVEDNVVSHLKGIANDVIDTFQKGIRYNNLGLEKLKEATIQGKLRKSYPKPETPLYGLGDREDKSYINMMRIRKLKNGYKIYQSKAKHHKSSLTLEQLFRVHEYGCTITTKAGVMIRIPPRPALHRAYERVMLRMKADKRETSRTVKRAMTEYINSSKQDLFNKMKEKDLAGHKEYEKND
jgi:hypothetical protein